MAGLTSKGAIAAGKDADLVIWRPEARADTATLCSSRQRVLP